MTFPNLVLGGAPKCGTSSVFQWLAAHPDVCASHCKETFYLMDTDNPLGRKCGGSIHLHGLSGYESLFEHCGECSRIVLEGTTHYLYQKTALQVLRDLPTQPQVLFVLREPATRVLSSFEYGRNVTARIDRALDFEEFVERCLSDDVDALRRYAPSNTEVLVKEVQYSEYVRWLAPWFEQLSRDRVRCVIFEELVEEAERELGRIAQFVGLEDSFYHDYDFPAHNPTYAVRSQIAQRFARRLGSVFPSGVVKHGLRRAYMVVQSSKKPNRQGAGVNRALARLHRHFEPYNQRLADLLGREIKIWGYSDPLSRL